MLTKRRKKPSLREKDIQLIQDLYFEEGWSQNDINEEFFGHSNSGYVSHIVNGQVISLEAFLAPKQRKMTHNIKPRMHEPKQGTILRAKREKLPGTKLSWAKAQAIRASYFAGMETQTALSKKFGICQSGICRILAGAIWKQIERKRKQ